jgi:hypothetical protein
MVGENIVMKKQQKGGDGVGRKTLEINYIYGHSRYGTTTVCK